MRKEKQLNNQKIISVPAIKKASKNEYYPVSRQQEGVWLQSQLDPGSTIWNTSHSWRYQGQLDIEALKKTLRELIRRHTSLRTNFCLRGDTIGQFINENFALDSFFKFIDISSYAAKDKEAAAARLEKESAQKPYDLEKSALARFTLIRFNQEDHLIIMGLHHIITDVNSRQVLWKELITLYNAYTFKKPIELEPIDIQYHDYAVWQQEFLKTPYYEKQGAYWMDQLGSLPVLNFPTDFPRRGDETNAGEISRYTVELDHELAGKLRTFSLRNRVPFSAVFLSAFYILLHKSGGQSDIVIGSLYRGRNIHKNVLNKIIGLFANFTALRLNLHEDIPIKKLLQEVDKKTRGAYENQDFQFEDLVRTLYPGRTTLHAPIFQVVFNMIKFTSLEMDPEGLTRKEWEPYKPDREISSQYDLSLYVRDEFRKITIRVLYCIDRFTSGTIKRILEQYTNILSGMLKEAGKALAEISIITEKEKQQLLYEFNDTEIPYARHKTLDQLFAEQVERTPNHIALAGIHETHEKHKKNYNTSNLSYMSYKKLNQKSHQLAFILKEKGVKAGTIVGLMVKRTIEMIIGIFAILKAGGAYLPIDPTFPQDRIDYMLKDSKAKILLTREEIAGLSSPEAFNICPKGTSFHLHLSPAPATSLAYLIYTSGSTGKPKGVMIPHQAVHNFITGISQRIDFSPGKTILALTTISFDIFVLETLLPLCRGLGVVVAGENLQRDLLLLEEFIVKHCLDMLQATPTRMQMFTHHMNNTRSSCLKNLKEIMVGGEPLPEKLLKDLQQLTAARIYNMYGPTETTVWSTMKELTDAEEVTIGGPIANTQIYILDKNHRVQPLGVVGELCIGGDGLARGYINNPELTAEVFLATDLHGRTRTTSAPPGRRRQKIYKTGDLARWFSDGNIQCLGRVDNQVKIRGFRIELEEIETLLNEYPGIKESVVTDITNETGGKSLCAYLVERTGISTKKPVSAGQLREHLTQKLPDYMIPSYFVKIDQLPLTANGKINRKALPMPGPAASIGTGTPYEAPRNEIEETLTAVWQEVLGITNPGINDNFFILGGDSIKAIQVASRLSAHGYQFDIGHLLRHVTIKDVTPYIKKEEPHPIQADEETHKHEAGNLDKEELNTIYHHFAKNNISKIYNLSPMQEGILFHYLLDTAHRAYQVQLAYLLEGQINIELFKESYEGLVERYDIFRTAFVYENVKQPRQVVLKQRETGFRYHDLTTSTGTNSDIEKIKNQERERGFHLRSDILLRFTLIKTHQDKYTLLITFHHIILDGWSTNLLMKEFITLYHHLKNNTPQETRTVYSYCEYIRWLEKQDMKAASDFWRNYFRGFDRVTRIQPHEPGREIDNIEYKRQQYNVIINKELIDKLSELAQQWNVTLNNILQAAWSVILQRYTGSEDIVFGNVISGRNIPLEGIDQTIGLFINTIPFRVILEEHCTFAEFTCEIKENLLDTQQNGHLSLGEIQGCAPVEGPLLQHLYIYENYPIEQKIRSSSLAEKIGFKIVNRTSDEHTNYHLDIIIIPREELRIVFQYNENVYQPAMVTRLGSHMKQLIDQVLLNPFQRLSDIEIITAGEKQQLLIEFNNTAADYPADKTLHQLFTDQAQKTPGHIALVGIHETHEKHQKNYNMSHTSYTSYISYKELNQKSHQLARQLIEKGVKPDTIVGLMLERSIEMIIGILGILKAGGAYLPIDPDYPEDRIQYILKDSGAKILLTGKEITGLSSPQAFNIHPKGASFHLHLSPAPVTSLAYIIYTSGSTGKPKGVLTQHASVVNFVFAQEKYFAITARDRVLQFTSFCFDPAMEQIFIALCSGSALVLITKDILMDIAKFEEFIAKQMVTHLHAVPSFLENMKLESAYGLKRIISGGEVCPVSLAKKMNAYCDFYNKYGPTETTITSIQMKVDVGYGDKTPARLPIGKPISNTFVYLLDPWLKPVPLGIVGELYIGGNGVARGYLNRPELTAEGFLATDEHGRTRTTSNKKFLHSKSAPPGRRRQTIYKTGDLARWLSDGNIEFLGRRDNQVKIRGQRIELEEIQAILNSHTVVKESIVTTINDEISGNSLCAYIVVQPGAAKEEFDILQLREHLNKKLPVYMVPAYFIRMEKLPLTANGKLDRKALPKPGEAAITQSPYEPPHPQNDIQQKLVSVWQDVLRLERIGINDNFFVIGGDSIKAIQIASRLNTHGYRLDITTLFKYPTIKQLWNQAVKISEEIEQKIVTGEIAPTPIREWFHEQDFTHKYHWNMAIMLHPQERFDTKILEQVFKHISAHHDLFRAVLSREKQTLIIKNVTDIEVPLEVIHLESLDHRELEKRIPEEANRIQAGIDLYRGSLIKTALFRTSQGDHLLIVIHHLVIDGISWRILFEDLSSGYQQAKAGRLIRFPAKTHSFKRWAEEINTYSQSEKLLKEYDYWHAICTAGTTPLPCKNKDQKNQTGKIKDYYRYPLQLDEQQSRLLLNDIHRAYNTEINDILLSALGLTINECFGLKQSVINLEGHGREQISPPIDISRTVGWFTSRFPVLLEVHDDEPGRENQGLSLHIRRCKESLRCIPHKGIGYGILRYISNLPGKDRKALEIQPEIGFNYLGQFDQDLIAAGFQKSPYGTGSARSLESQQPHKININGMVVNGKLNFNFSFDSNSFERNQAETFARCFKENLQKIITHCREIEEPCYTPADFDAQNLDFDELAAIYEYFPANSISKIYDLTTMQEGMLFHYLMDPLQRAYLVQLVYLLEGNIGAALCKESYQRLIRQYDVFRTAFVYKNIKQPRQVVLKQRETLFSYHDISSAANRTTEWEHIKNRDQQKGFHLSSDPLIRFTLVKTHQDKYTLLSTFHHLIMDGWSTNLLMKEFIAIYQSLKNNHPHDQEMGYPYLDYIKWLADQDMGTAKRYWQDYLQGFDQVTRIPTAGSGAGIDNQEYKNREYTFTIDKDIHRRVQALARQWNVTLNNVLQAVWCVILQRYSGTDDIVFGNVISGRNISLPGIDQIMGLFINTIPMRVKINPQQPLKQMVKNLQENLMESQTYGFLSLGEIQGYAAVEGQLVEHLYIYENYPVDKEIRSNQLTNTAGFKINKRYSIENTNYHLNLMIIPRADLYLVLQYKEDVYRQSFVSALAGHIQWVLQQVAHTPDLAPAQIEIITQEEKQQLLVEFNRTEAPYPKDRTLHQLFEEQVNRTPDHVALLGIQETHQKHQINYNMSHMSYTFYISYKELNQKAYQLALLLKEKGVKPDTIVGIMMERSLEMIVGIFAIIKAGGAYLPIDPTYPQDRIDYMLKDSGAKILLAAPEAKVKVKAEAEERFFEMINIANLFPPSTLTSTSTCQVGPANLAYLIYTSGSTGKPKGVMVEHGPLLNRLNWMQKKYPIGPGDTILHKTPFTFDVSVWEIFWWSLQGARVCLLAPRGEKDPRQMIEAIASHRVTVMHFVPSMLSLFLDYVNQSNHITIKRLASLKQVIASGEALGASLVQLFNQLLAGNGSRLANLYGPTEATIDVSYFDSPAAGDINRVPIGKPIDNIGLWVLHKGGQLQPIGAAGELGITGHGLARGYLNRPELTAEKFYLRLLTSVPSVSSVAKNKIYKTGDLARWLPDGNIEYLGRIDHQVKIRGFRIELGEIENRLNHHPHIKESVVTIITDKTHNKNLCAYFVTDLELTLAQLREYLAGHLPDYMIPSYFVQLEKIPLTANGKIDRKSLPGPDKSLAAASEYAAPTNEIETLLVEIWQELLNIKEIGINHNFFELGGHSLLVMNMVLKIQHLFRIEIPMWDIFNHPTIAQIAKKIQINREKIKKFARILMEIEAMSEEQIDEILLKQ